MLNSMLTLIVTLASAVEGGFTYNGEHSVLASVRYESVVPTSNASKARLSQLKNDGYLCEAHLELIQCRKIFDNLSTLPDSIANTLPRAQQVHFGSLQSMDLISLGHNLAHYNATQDVVVDGIHFSSVNYLEGADLVKAIVGSSTDPKNHHSFIVNKDAVSIFDAIDVSESKSAHTIYHVEFYLSRNID